MLPVCRLITEAVPINPFLLYLGLLLGASVGGNVTPIGASANIVTAGLAERAGYSVTFGQFARRGIPVTIMSLLVATAWLLLMNWLS